MYLFFKSIFAAILVSGVVDLHFLIHKCRKPNIFKWGGGGCQRSNFYCKGGEEAPVQSLISKLNLLCTF